jgi:hypothetical protein
MHVMSLMSFSKTLATGVSLMGPWGDPMASVQGGVLMVVFFFSSCRQPQQQASPLMMAPFHHNQ